MLRVEFYIEVAQKLVCTEQGCSPIVDAAIYLLTVSFKVTSRVCLCFFQVVKLYKE